MPPELNAPVGSLAELKALSAGAAPEKAPEPAQAPAAPASSTAPDAPAPAPAKDPASPAVEKSPPAAPSAEKPAEQAWAPNYKLKVMDQEKEIPEAFRALIKDAASEKEVREIFEKAYGLEHAKPKHEAVKQELGQVKQAHGQVTQRMQQWEGNLKRLEGAAQAAPESADFEQFLSFWKIKDEALYKYVQRKLEYQEQLEAMSPAARAQVEHAQQAEAQARQVQAQNQQLQQAYAQQALQQRLGQVDQLVHTRPDIAEVAQQYCAGKKDPTAFKKLVQSVAQQAYYATGKDLSVEDAIREAMSLMGYEEVDATAAQSPQAPVGQPSAAAYPAAPIVAPATQKKLPVIPTVGSGSGAAPVKKVAGSIAELRAMRADMLKAQQ